MTFQADQFVEEAKKITTNINGRWVLCRPEEWRGWYKWILRAKEAILVLKGKVDTIVWYKQ